MARKNRNGERNERGGYMEEKGKKTGRLHPDTTRSIWAVVCLGVALILSLAGFQKAGPVGEWIFMGLEYLLGWGYFLLPIVFVVVAGILFAYDRKAWVGLTTLGAVFFVLSVLGLIHIFSPGNGGILGMILGSLKAAFGNIAAVVINIIVALISALVTLNTPLRLTWFKWKKQLADALEIEEEDESVLIVGEVNQKKDSKEEVKGGSSGKNAGEDAEPEVRHMLSFPSGKKATVIKFKDYVPPPLDLLRVASEKPTTGDLRANANIIKRTLESFGIIVEMGEINVGPKFTRYTLKPAEGMKLSRITALGSDLALALAAHPIRIEAPIPGKSLVGIEVPNRAAAAVRLGGMLGYPEFQGAGPLAFALGRDVMGEPLYANIEKMPHLLIAGATGTGKSVALHSLIVSLLYKNSPSNLRFIMIDPKRVELSMYENIPHLVGPVITDNKKALAVFRYAIGEMEKRYETFQKCGNRDIKSYNQAGGKDNPLPYLMIVVDEMADLMKSYGREVESSVVRLAQMARATGIHLILSTQRPSVEVITGLIKANITYRIALKVFSQIDSRTILDTGGAETLLGGGDMLFTSADNPKPHRLQGALVTEEEIIRVADFVRENNQAVMEDTPLNLDNGGSQNGNGGMTGYEVFDEFADQADEDDELYDEAVRVVREARKASASYLQRRLAVGYARAAKLLDIMEERGVVGPGEGAKPREVFLDPASPQPK
ncbi:MAG: DNA translocase FtsK [Candidatus Liptonbacteria bacterium]